MAKFKDAYIDYQLKRFMRPDAHRYLRPDWRRYWKPGSEADPLYRYYDGLERKYRPDQPRVPSGSREGGQWIDGGGSGGAQNSDGASMERLPQKVALDCELMHRQDLFICKSVQSRPCYAQAYLRYSNCTRGRPIPPLNF